MVLLGAGASVEAGVPATVEMSRRILESFQDDPWSVDTYQILSFAIGGLVFQRGIRGQDPYLGVDVEELFAAVQLLARRNSLEAAPFIGSWHTSVDELDRTRNYSTRRTAEKVVGAIYEATISGIEKSLPRRTPRSKVDKELEQFLKGRSSKPPALDAAIANAVTSYVSEWIQKAKRTRPRAPSFFDRDFGRAVESQSTVPADGGAFATAAEQMIQALSALVWLVDPARVEYLEPLAQAAYNQGSLTIATLNYDNTIELLGESHHQAVHRGLQQWSESGRFDLPEDGLRVLKLHGSIDWVLRGTEPSQERPLRRQAVALAGEEEMKERGFRPAVVFGQGSKLTAEGPFLDLLHTFRQELSKHGHLVVVGYSFRDDHVNEYIAQWINGDGQRRMTIIDPMFGSNPNPFVRQLSSLGEGRLRVIPQKTGDGLKLETLVSS